MIAQNLDGELSGMADGFLRGLPVRENARQFRDFRNPAAIHLLFALHRQFHGGHWWAF